MEITKKYGSSTLLLKMGDITKEKTEAIVNAANSSLLGGGGVDGAIHRAGGPKILEECQEIRAKQKSCPTGEAVITSGGKLPAKHVIHAVGPIWRGGDAEEEKLLASAYRNSLRVAEENGIRTLAFPSISTGAYGFPIEKAAKIALETVIEFLKADASRIEEVRFLLFSEADFHIFRQTLAECE